MTDTCPRLPVPEKWDAHKISSQKGKIAVVTGANSGIGYETALELARNGAHAARDACFHSRNWHRGVHEIGRGDLSSVEKFSEEFKAKYKRLDLLINNAGVAGGDFTLSEDGYESLFATNHLGHFALTARLFALIKSSTPSRIVNVSSQVHRQPKVFDEDEIMLNDAEKYSPMQNYGVTKLYNIMFAKELNRRMKANGVEGVTAAACHPGLSVSGLTSKTASASSSWLWWLFYKVAVYFPSQSAQMGALPTLYAAVGDAVEGGDYFGPNYLGLYGHPIREAPSGLSDAKDAAAKLWAFSEKLAKLAFEVSK
ncbi:short chain dehydrogenase [Phytophthora infestans]|uniref:Short chain dehydrogenase n=1 Tax=Phytophthora infestans TaxID=4787 RepID=A0A833STI4_PHYIN|nr:short chain dehydrogenase [Phytophthora infestans]KAF4148285.1 short chain dehydrogenase [Phytophthora infestans]